MTPTRLWRGGSFKTYWNRYASDCELCCRVVEQFIDVETARNDLLFERIIDRHLQSLAIRFQTQRRYRRGNRCRCRGATRDNHAGQLAYNVGALLRDVLVN